MLEGYPEAYNVMMAMAAGFAILLQYLFNRGLSHHDLPGAIYLEAFIMGPIFGLLCYFLVGWLFAVVGRRFGGVGTPAQNRMVWAWCFVPYITGMIVLWTPMTLAAIVRAQFIYSLPDWAKHGLLNLEVFFYYAFIPFWCWALYVMLIGLMVVNKYTWRGAILTTAFSYVLVYAFYWLCFMVFHLIGMMLT